MTIVPGSPPNAVDPNDPEFVSYYDPGGTSRVGPKSSVDPGGGGGGGSFPDFTGSGSPEGVQTANANQTYLNLADASLWVFHGTDGTNTGWATSAIVISDYSDQVTGPNVTFDFDGSEHLASATVVSPPNWMDDAGNIILPGQYLVSAKLSISTPATTPGLYVRIVGTFNGDWLIPVDPVAEAPASFSDDVQSLGPDDLPYTTEVGYHAPTDDTGQGLAKIIVQRLIYNAAYA